MLVYASNQYPVGLLVILVHSLGAFARFAVCLYTFDLAVIHRLFHHRAIFLRMSGVGERAPATPGSRFFLLCATFDRCSCPRLHLGRRERGSRREQACENRKSRFTPRGYIEQGATCHGACPRSGRGRGCKRCSRSLWLCGMSVRARALRF